MSDYWVIREGKVRGQGRYWTDNGLAGRVGSLKPYFGGWSLTLAQATRYEARFGGQTEDRFVRVTRKVRQTVTLEHHVDTVERVCRQTLEMAEQACRDVRAYHLNSRDTFYGGAEACERAIAALRGDK